MIKDVIQNSINSHFNKEHFDNIDAMPSVIKTHPLASLLTLLVVWVLILLIGKYLWNTCVVSLAPNTVAPAKSIFLYSTRHKIKAVTNTSPERT